MKLLTRLFLLTLLLYTLDILRYGVFPNINSLQSINPKTSAFMQYRQDQWQKSNKSTTLEYRWVNIHQMSPNIINAVLIGEDDRFYKHNGFDTNGMMHAIKRSLSGSIAGGSTITQQVAKNLYLSPTKNPSRKVKEAIITWRLEKNLSKERILEIYLNIAEWGDGIFGIEAASRFYYHKSSKRLTKKEAARLAAVLPNPIRFNPRGSQDYVVNRSKTILKVLKKRG